MNNRHLRTWRERDQERELMSHPRLPQDNLLYQGPLSPGNPGFTTDLASRKAFLWGWDNSGPVFLRSANHPELECLEKEADSVAP